MVYGDLVLWLVFGPLVLVAAAFTLRSLAGLIGLKAEAESDFDYRRQNEMMAAHIDRDDFVRTYTRINRPRGAIHVAAALWGALLATPIIAVILEWLLVQLWQLSGQSRVFEPGYLVWAFFIFFGLLAAWAGIGYVVARHFHRNTPGRLEDELAALK